MKILISGASGFVGKALQERLSGANHEIHSLVRRTPKSREIEWDPEEGDFAAGALEGFDAVVHLAGENIAGGRWTEGRKRRIRDSRVKGTKYLSNALAGLSRKPKVMICASAIGYYGDRGSEVLQEDSNPGTGFLAEVCKEWEAATNSAKNAGIRVVNVRIGIVLGKKGGALQKMLIPFKMGVGGVIGTGEQYMSWVSLEDLTSIIEYAIGDDKISGPINGVSPQPVTNKAFTKTLGKVLHRPTIFPMPAKAAELVMGEMAKELLLASMRVEPVVLKKSGYTFRYADLETCLRAIV